MPLLKFHLYKGRSTEEIGLLLDAAHEAMVLSFGVPTGDRYQVVSEYEPSHMQALDTGLGIPRTANFVLLEVVPPRSTTCFIRQKAMKPHARPIRSSFGSTVGIRAAVTSRKSGQVVCRN